MQEQRALDEAAAQNSTQCAGALKDNSGWGRPILLADVAGFFEATVSNTPGVDDMDVIRNRKNGSMCCFAVRSLPPDLVTASSRVDAMCKVKFSYDQLWHEQLLQTVWMKLTNDSSYCQRIGEHWSDIGFQGLDPLTDLRGAGLFGLFTMLHIVSRHGKMTRRIKLELQSCYPFAATSLNFTMLSVHALRNGLLNSTMCRRHSLPPSSGERGISAGVGAVCELHAACFHRLYRIWRAGKKARTDIGFVFQQIESEARNKKGVAKLLSSYAADRFAELNVAAQKQNGGGGKASNINFTDLETKRDGLVEF